MEPTSTAFEVGKAVGGLIACFLFVAIPVFFIVSLILAITRKSRAWTIATVITGTLGLLFIVGSLAFGFYSGFQAVKEGRKAGEFTTSDGLAMITGAAGWRILELNSEDATLSVGNLFAEEYLIVISEAKSIFEPGFGLTDFAEVASEQTIDSIEGAIVTELVAKTVNGMPAFEREISGEIEGIDITYFNTYLEGGSHFHQVLTWTLTKRKEKTMPNLKAAAASFREVAASVVP
jgi:hypothetical protein